MQKTSIYSWVRTSFLGKVLEIAKIKLYRPNTFAGILGALLLAADSASAGGGWYSNPPSSGLHLNREFNEPGNILIADQFNNRVIEATPGGKIVWSFGLGPNDSSSNSIIGCNDSQRVGPLTLMCGTGTPAGVITNFPGGLVDNRVLLVDAFGRVIWQYGQFGQTGSGPNLLSTPVQCTFLPTYHFLITDQGNNRIIEVTLNSDIVWQYPAVGDTNAGDLLSSPNSAELLANGNILIADQGNNRAIEVTRADVISNTYTAGGTLGNCAFASRLPNGHTLLTDTSNARAVEVDAHDKVVWQYYTTNSPKSILMPLPTRAVRLRDGNTLISDQFNNRVILVDHGKQIVARYGLPLDGGGTIGNNIGYGTNSTQQGLYSPYDAKIIGDYTGLTPPIDDSGDGYDQEP